MTEPELAVVSAAGAGLGWIFRWAVALWATVRREEVEASKVTAAAQRAESGRMVEALLAQARSNAELGGTIERSKVELAGKFDQLAAKIDDWRERTPVEGVPVARDDAFTSERPASERDARRRLRTVPHGHRTNKDRDDE